MKKILIFCFKALAAIFLIVLGIFGWAMGVSGKRKEYEPTQNEIACGEKMLSGEYFIPEDKL